MNHDEYQNAFSWLEPSPDAVASALKPERRRAPRRAVRPGAVLLAAVLAVALLTGAAFAASEFGWFRLGGAEQLVTPAGNDPDAFGKREAMPPAPQNLLRFDGASSETRVGFTLPEDYLAGQDSLNTRMLGDGLYGRYYRDPDPGDPGSPLLSAEILYNASYLTREPSELVKEEELNGLQTVWLRLDSSADGRARFCLFQHSDTLGCYALIASSESFAEAERLAADMRWEDSGIPLAQTQDEIWYGFRLGRTPEGMSLDHAAAMADRWYLANATLRDQSLDLSEVLLASNWYSKGEPSCNVGLWLTEGLKDIAPVENGAVYKTGTILGREARWAKGYDGKTYIAVLFPEEQVQLNACVSCFGINAESGETGTLPAEERFVKTAEQLLESAELIPVAIAEPAPLEFDPFSVG